jgi:NAD+ synthase
MIPKINVEETTTIITDFIKTYTQNSGCEHIVLGLSGGLDSAVATVLCQQAIGKQNVTSLFMPDKQTPTRDTTHQKILIKKFDIQSHIIPIDTPINEIQKSLSIENKKLTISNIKARLRMILLYAYANEHNCLVCGTSNKSELLVGYFTKYGDGGADIQPLADIYKTQLYQLAQHLNIPQEIIQKPPCAGLWKNQTDEQELQMNYTTLDTILFGIEQRLTAHQIQTRSQIPLSEINRIIKKVKTTQHKRRKPLTPKLSLRTPAVDWRQPIQNG